MNFKYNMGVRDSNFNSYNFQCKYQLLKHLKEIVYFYLFVVLPPGMCAFSCDI